MKNLKAVCDEYGIRAAISRHGAIWLWSNDPSGDRRLDAEIQTPYTEADFPGPDPVTANGMIDRERVVACCLAELGYYASNPQLNIDREHIGKTTVRAYVLGLRAVLGDLGQYLEAMEADLPLDSLEADFRALDIGHDPMSVEFELQLMPVSFDELYDRLFEKDKDIA